MRTIHEKQSKKLLRRGTFAEPFFGNLYSFSPYASCEHGCIYCDGRAEKYHLEGDFANDITARINGPELLAAELPKQRIIAPVHLASGISDVYQPAERELQLTRRCAEELAKHPFPVSVLTKNSLILRDFDLWMAVHKRSQFHLQLSLTTLDETIRERFEPGASPIEERLEVVRRFKEAGCPVGIFMMPLLPGLTDTTESLLPFIQTMKELDVDYIMPGYLTLRPGRQKQIYLDLLTQHYPALHEQTVQLYSNNAYSGNPLYTYRQRWKSQMAPLLGDMPIEIPHRIYRDTMPLHQELLLLFQHMKSLYRRKRIDVTRLSEAADRFETWCGSQLKQFNRKRSLPLDHIDTQLLFLLQTGGFATIIQNEKLEQFMGAVLLERKVFDYRTLTLEA